MSDSADLPASVDALIASVTSAPTPSDRSARVREWLASAPSAEQLAEAHKQLERRDRAAARLVQEHQADIERTRRQDAIAEEWRVRIQAILDAPTLDMAAATNWQRDAARAGAPLSREPLATLKARLSEAMRQVEDLQRRSQVQREAAVLLAQRIEVLSAKSWRDADHAAVGLEGDVHHWLSQRQSLTEQPSWGSVPERFAQQLTQAGDQLQLVWRTFSEALAAARAAAQDEAAPLPGVAVWDDEIRIQRGEMPAAPVVADVAALAATATAAQPLTRTPEQRQADALAHVQAALAKYVAARATEGLHPDQIQGIFDTLATALRHQGRWLSAQQAAQVHEALLAAGDAQGWQPERAEAERTQLLASAQKLQADEAISAPKLQNALRELRTQWKALDHLYPANAALWKQFDQACSAAHLRVQAWLEQSRGQVQQHRAQRQALIEEVRLWGEQLAANVSPDWREVSRSIGQFLQRWRESGHVGEKIFAELQAQWKQTLAAAEAPFKAAQKASQERRNALIEAARGHAEAASLDIEAIKALQENWKQEAQTVPLERKLEQKLWEAFRAPIDLAFQRHPARGERRGEQRGAERAPRTPASLSAEQRQALPAADRAVLAAADALSAAIQSGDASAIRAAMAALEAARQNPEASASQAPAAEAKEQVVEAAQPTQAQPSEPATDAATESASTPVAPRVVRAVRGDDRPGARMAAAAADARGSARGGAGRGRDGGARSGAARDVRAGAAARPVRLGDAAFRAQRHALEEAEAALRRLSAQAHGQTLTELGAAWAARDAERVPAAAALGKLPAATRAAWTAAIGAAPVAAAPDAALLRLEIAADVPSPAAHQAERRAAQLQLLTQRNKAATPDQTWREDAATVLASAHSAAAERRLTAALKALLKL